MDDNLRQTIQSAQSLLKELDRLGIPKSESLNRLTQRLAERVGIYPPPNLAVELCVQAYLHVHQLHLDGGSSAPITAMAGKLAYCSHLPMLSNADTVRDFVACVVHGMAIGAIPGADGTRLLYGAQVAHTVARPIRLPGRPAKSPTTQEPNCAPTPPVTN